MDTDLIKSLIAALEASSLEELEYSADGFTLRLVKAGGLPPTAAPPQALAPTPTPARAPAPAPAPAPATPTSTVIAAPMFGTVHLSRSPGLPPFVSAGDPVVAGQVVCLIEAMKVFTELRAEQDGTLAAVLVQTGQEVEPGQPLFRLGA